MKTPITNFALLALVVGLFLIFNQTNKAQSALDGFDPNADAPVLDMVIQPDNKIIIVGAFTNIGGQSRTRIARLNTDGTLDSTLNATVDGQIEDVALQSDGKILIAGGFNVVNGETRRRFARLNADGTLDAAFEPFPGNIGVNGVTDIKVKPNGKILIAINYQPFPNNQARVGLAQLNTDGTLDTTFEANIDGQGDVIELQPDGKILLGGQFHNVSMQPRERLARLNSDGSLDASFVNPAFDALIFAIAVQADGKILAGGMFQNAGGQPRNKLARLNSNGTLDTAFDASVGAETSRVIEVVKIQPDGKILFGGNFDTVSGQARRGFARIKPDGSLDASFIPNLTGLSSVHALALQIDAKILVGGIFSTIGGQTRNNIARLERDGSLDQTLNLGTIGQIFATAIQPDGKILIGGSFSNILGTPRNHLARLNADGTLDTGFNPNVSGFGVYSIAIQPDGKILIGGDFNGVGGASVQTRNCIARLNADGTLDTGFDPNANGAIVSIVIQPDGKILVGGGFNGVNSIGGQTRNYIARLISDGTVDSFDPSANYAVRSISLMPDGKILIGGFFTIISGQTRNHLARLNSDGTADSFDPNPNGSFVEAIAVQADGKILVGGSFGIIGGQPRSNLARLNTDGTVDSFNPIAGNAVESIAIQSDGKIIVGGQFITINGQPRNYIARLNANGTVDSFDPNASNSVYSIALQSDGKILAGGFFSTIGGQSRGGFARLSNDTAAISTLTVNKTSVALTRDGSAPQFSRVVFEQSIDNGATYTTLGTATNNRSLFAGDKTSERIFAPDAPTASGYTLTGLNLPTGQNILIRARGIYRSGSQNGSETTEEKVQNAFLLAPTAAAVSISGRVTTPLEFGLTSALVTLTDMQGNSRTVLTGKFGSYRFADVLAGETYILTVASRRYTFVPQVITVTEDIREVNFTAQ